MKRRHRRVLFNVFAFSLLGTAIYLNMFRMYDHSILSAVKTVKAPSESKRVLTMGNLSKVVPAKNLLSLNP